MEFMLECDTLCCGAECLGGFVQSVRYGGFVQSVRYGGFVQSVKYGGFVQSVLVVSFRV